jgi:class 3 adenylate cyclase
MSSIDFESLTLREIIQLQNELSTCLARRFEKWLAIIFSDIVGSTAYFQRYGDQAGRQIQQRHLDLLTANLEGSDGRIVDTAGDGALLAFPRIEDATEFSIRVHRAHWHTDRSTLPEHRWRTRTCIHWGPTLTDGAAVTGDTVNLCAKLAATGLAHGIFLTSQAVSELSKRSRAACHPLESIQLPGLPVTIEVFQLYWKDQQEIPRYLVILETGQRMAIPDKSVIACGRFSDQNSANSNDIILTLDDPILSQRISRWHFELRSEADQLFLRAVSDKPTVVNGICLRKGDQAAIENGTCVQLSGVMTLTFEPEQAQSAPQEQTLPHHQSL